MKTEEDEAFDELARRQGMWGGGFPAKRQAAMDKQEPWNEDEWRKNNWRCHHGWLRGEQCEICNSSPAPKPAQEPDALTIAYQSGYYDGKQAALARREWNFCERCGKRTADKTVIHTCTPPQGEP
jgi:hypothetical protein